MKRFTIKALILSLSMLFVSNANASLGSGVVVLGLTCAVGAAVGAAVVGFAGGVICIGYNIVRSAFSQKKMSKAEKEERKKRIREARAERRKARREKKAKKGGKVATREALGKPADNKMKLSTENCEGIEKRGIKAKL